MAGPEANIEKYLKQRVTDEGGLCMKCTGFKDAPDRIVILAGMTVFVEVKAEGEVPRDSQIRMFNKMVEAGGFVFVIDTKDKVEAYIDFVTQDMDALTEEPSPIIRLNS